MSIVKRRSIITFCSVMALFFGAKAFGSETMLPDGLVMEDKFNPGVGSPVGKVQLVLGKVVIMHKDMSRGYWAKKGLPLYNGDRIVSQDKGFVRFKLKDGSMMSLGSKTKLVINRSIYDSKKKKRSSFLKMTVGKTLFRVTKKVNFKQSKFKVQTSNAVIGVRGSEFVVRATLVTTEVTAMENTQVEVVSSAFPEAKPVTVADFERTTVEQGAPASEVETVSPEEIQDMKREFRATPQALGPTAKIEARQRKVQRKEGVKGKSDKGGAEKGKSEAAKGKAGVKDESRPAETKGQQGQHAAPAGKQGEGDDSQGKEAQDQDGEEAKGQGEDVKDEESESNENQGQQAETGDSGEAQGESEAGEEGASGQTLGGEVAGEGGVAGTDLGEGGESQTGAGEAVMSEEGAGEVSFDEGAAGEEIQVVVSDEDIVMPEDIAEVGGFEEVLTPDVVVEEEVANPEEEVMEQTEKIYEGQHEETVEEQLRELPSFPGTP